MKRSGLGTTLLVYTAALIALITLAPFRFHQPDSLEMTWLVSPFDLLTNILLFLPLGFFYGISIGTANASPRIGAFIFGLSLSFSVEIAQLYLPGRYTSPVDMMANAAGAWLGSVLFTRIRHRLSRQTVRRMALELPLTNILYLTVPLLWLNGFLAEWDPDRPWLAALIGLFGAVVLEGIWRHRVRDLGVSSPGEITAIYAGWFLAGCFPLITRSPGFVLLTTAILAGLFRSRIRRPRQAESTERRFELPTLSRSSRFYILYLVLTWLGPWPWVPGGWEAIPGLSSLQDTPGVLPILQLVENFAAMTLAGYMLAEARGRFLESTSKLGLWSLLVCGGGTAILELIRGFHPLHHASLLRWGLGTAASLSGATIYRLQIVAIQHIRMS